MNIKINDFTNTFFNSLEENNVKYCVIGNYHCLPDYTEHDIDIWVENITRFKNIFKYVLGKTKYEVLQYNKTANGFNCILQKIKNTYILMF